MCMTRMHHTSYLFHQFSATNRIHLPFPTLFIAACSVRVQGTLLIFLTVARQTSIRIERSHPAPGMPQSLVRIRTMMQRT